MNVSYESDKPAASGILSAIGNTPLVELERVAAHLPVRLLAKIEALNPGGSIKDRTAKSILSKGLATGEIRSGTVVVESSSGNMAIGLAQACAVFGLRFVCVIDAKTTAQNVAILRAYGAEIELVDEPDPDTGEYLQARILRVRTLLDTIENSFWPAQYSNPQNPAAHYDTMREIVTQAGGPIDYLFCSTSTCGTLRGCAEYLRRERIATRVVAVDAVGSAIFGDTKAKRLIPGHGAARVPELFREGLADEVVHVSDLECVVGCRRLVRREGILAGGSSGGVLMAVERVRDRLARGATCALIFPDRGERYLDTVFSDSWVAEHFGDVEHLWDAGREGYECRAATS